MAGACLEGYKLRTKSVPFVEYALMHVTRHLSLLYDEAKKRRSRATYPALALNEAVHQLQNSPADNQGKGRSRASGATPATRSLPDSQNRARASDQAMMGIAETLLAYTHEPQALKRLLTEIPKRPKPTKITMKT